MCKFLIISASPRRLMAQSLPLLQPWKGSSLCIVFLPRKVHWSLSIQNSFWEMFIKTTSVYLIQNFRPPGWKQVLSAHHMASPDCLGKVNHSYQLTVNTKAPNSWLPPKGQHCRQAILRMAVLSASILTLFCERPNFIRIEKDSDLIYLMVI